MIDLHVHAGMTGAACPSEMMALARAAGYRAVALLARCDAVSLPLLLPSLVHSCHNASLYGVGEALPGVELVHIPPPLIAETVEQARCLGALIVAVHGELPGEAVPPGTTLAAIQAKADFVAHPGLLSVEEAALAAENAVALELSLCPRHAAYNGHVAARAKASGAQMVTGSNARFRTELIPLGLRTAMLRGAGLEPHEADIVDANCLSLFSRAVSRGRKHA